MYLYWWSPYSAAQTADFASPIEDSLQRNRTQRRRRRNLTNKLCLINVNKTDLVKKKKLKVRTWEKKNTSIV